MPLLKSLVRYCMHAHATWWILVLSVTFRYTESTKIKCDVEKGACKMRGKDDILGERTQSRKTTSNLLSSEM